MLEVFEKQRPMFLDLTKMHFPVMAVVSIFHRITGVLIFLFLPLMLYILHQAYKSADTYTQLTNCLQHASMKFFIWAMLSAVWFHVIAGIRHMIMDCGIAENVKSARVTAYSVFAFAIVLSILMGVWLW